jgi:hypothetical protein
LITIHTFAAAQIHHLSSSTYCPIDLHSLANIFNLYRHKPKSKQTFTMSWDVGGSGGGGLWNVGPGASPFTEPENEFGGGDFSSSIGPANGSGGDKFGDSYGGDDSGGVEESGGRSRACFNCGQEG